MDFSLPCAGFAPWPDTFAALAGYLLLLYLELDGWLVLIVIY